MCETKRLEPTMNIMDMTREFPAEATAVMFVFSLEDALYMFNRRFQRILHALWIISELGEPRPSDVRKYLAKRRTITYASFLNAISDLREYGIVVKERGKYKIKDEYASLIRKILRTPIEVAKILAEVAESGKKEEGLASLNALIGTLAELLPPNRHSKAQLLLEQLYTYALYIIDKAMRTITLLEAGSHG